MTSSSERVTPHTFRTLPTPELRTGDWTRLGDDTVLGDAVTERALAGLAESTRSAARAQGYSVGWAEGRREAAEAAAAQAAEDAAVAQAEEARREAEHRSRLAALDQAAARLAAAVATTCAAVESQASELAWSLTRDLVGHELRCAGEEAGPDVVRRVLAVLPPEAAVVRLHPAEVDEQVVAALAPHGVRAVGDPALAPGDAVVEASDQVVDLRFSAALERLALVLAPGARA
ncbi:FliH/SctL family protein [Nocardioides perillae]|uniref:Flagellar assembly protein FliH n=1 Tax=Nocardioides perillae TaxID=1119534 RepID=A0A7Y9RZW8_9ACTN|nr:FliH/SctL family protein [Nocardioides perillae]NYG57035.1 flagellar assembly protein FliH [Nocardioides perillae]